MLDVESSGGSGDESIIAGRRAIYRHDKALFRNGGLE